MGQKIKIDELHYDLDEMSSAAKGYLKSLQFTSERIKELHNMRALLTRAKNSYLESIKAEILSKKAGFLLEDD
jgi:hypothetical protein